MIINPGMRRSGVRRFSPLALFAASETGVWYDPSDLTTLFQDTSGITPVTAAGQTVALMLDKSRVPAPEARRNIVFNSDTLSGWLSNGGTNSTITTTNPFGVSTTVAQTSSAVVDAGRYLTPATTVGVTYTSSIWLKSVSGATIVRTGNNKIAGWVDVDLSNGTITAQGAAVTASSIENSGSGWYRVSCQYVATAAGTSIISYNRGTTTTTFIMWGAQLEAGSTLTTYQAIGASLPTAWRGTHATQATAAARPTYGIEPVTGRQNFILYSNTFSNAAWEKLNATLTANDTTDPFGGNNAWRFQTSGAGYIRQFTSELLYSTNVRQSIYVRSNTGSSQTFALKQFWNNPISLTATTAWQRFDVVSSESFTAGGVFIEGTNLDLHIFGAQLNTGTTPTAYQETTTRFDVTEAGVASKSYLRFDGVDDGMATSAINFTATDKMTVFGGVRKLSDAGGTGMLVEFTSGAFDPTQRSFFLAAPGYLTKYTWRTGGTSNADVNLTDANLSAPITNVLTGVGDIASDTSILRVNGVQRGSSSADQGTGNFTTAQLFIGRRGGTMLQMNGQIYSLIVRGAATDAATITSTETWVNSRTGAY